MYGSYSPGSIEAGTRYVSLVLDPFRGEETRISRTDLRVVTSLVDMFEDPIVKHQIPPHEFLNTLVGLAALQGADLTNPSSPKQLANFTREVDLLLDEHFGQESA